MTLEELKEPLTISEIDELKKCCDNELGPKQPARSTSAIYVDKNHEPVLFYFGKRIVVPNQKPPVSRGVRLLRTVL